MRRALGKGLAQLLGETNESVANELRLEDIIPNPDQPRQLFEETALEDLAESIKQVGILQPLIVRPISEGKYALVAGERRWRAARLAGLSTVPVIVRTADDEASLKMAIIENVQREDIGPVEQAIAYKRLIQEFGLTQEDVADSVGKSRSSITNLLRILKLPSEVQQALMEGLITEGHSRALLMCPSPDLQLELFYRIVDEGLTVRQAETLARATTQAKEKPIQKPVAKQAALDPSWHTVTEAASIYLGAPVKLEKAKVGGKMVIEFFSDDDLDRILDVLGIRL